MTGTDTFTVGEVLPRIRSVTVKDAFQVTVTWDAGPRVDRVETVDLAPALFKYKVYAALRDNLDLFRSAHISDDGFAVAWGDDDQIDMASTTIEELAGQAMTPADFAVFVKRNGYTLDSIAAELGISRRLAAYYQSERELPRYIALACKYLQREHGTEPVLSETPAVVTRKPGDAFLPLVAREV